MLNGSSSTTCCVVGGGPAGVMLGFLLARRGVPVTVLEKHKDFNRDFRGDTVHPSTLQIMYELGLLESFLKIPHQKIETVGGIYGDFPFTTADFRHVPAHSKFAALMPQWDFLNFLTEEASRYSTFDLRMRHEAIDLVWEGDQITSVIARDPDRKIVEIHAGLVIGCDGRSSVMRTAGQLDLVEAGVPMDVLWFRITRHADDPDEVLGNVNYGKVLILINRGDYFQAGLVVAKDSFPAIQERGLHEFRSEISRIAPYLNGRADEIESWDQVKVLTVKLNRLRQWYRPGLLCIGDAAHAMSPVGGVGINLAIQDAVAAANLLAVPLRAGRVTLDHLAAVQRRREFPARLTQAVQARAHGLLTKVFQQPGPVQAPWQLKAAVRIPGIRRVIGYAVGIGFRPEHVQQPAVQTPRPVPLFRAVFCAAIGFAITYSAIRKSQRRARLMASVTDSPTG